MSRDYADILRVISPFTEIFYICHSSYKIQVHIFCTMNMNIIFYI